MDDNAWNAINRMNSIKSSFTPKWGRNFGRKKKSTNSVKNMTKFFRLDHFAERYLGKLDDVQCHRNVTELETHIEYIQEHYQNEKF